MTDDEWAEIEDGAQLEIETGGQSSLILTAISLVGAVLIGATAALVVWKLVLQPRLVEAEPLPAQTRSEIPEEPFMAPFDSALATVTMPSDDYLAPTLTYGVGLNCSDQIRMDLVIMHNARRMDMIRKLHQVRTRDELNDPMTDDSIQTQIVQESNTILLASLKSNASEHRVTNAFLGAMVPRR